MPSSTTACDARTGERSRSAFRVTSTAWRRFYLYLTVHNSIIGTRGPFLDVDWILTVGWKAASRRAGWLEDGCDGLDHDYFWVLSVGVT